MAQSLSCSKSFLLGFPRLGLHPEVDCCVLIYSLRGCSESYLTTGLIGVYYCQPTVAIRTARRSGWVDGGGSSPALPNPALTQSKHLKGGHWIRCRGDSPGFCLSEGFLLVCVTKGCFTSRNMTFLSLLGVPGRWITQPTQLETSAVIRLPQDDCALYKREYAKSHCESNSYQF